MPKAACVSTCMYTCVSAPSIPDALLCSDTRWSILRLPWGFCLSSHHRHSSSSYTRRAQGHHSANLRFLKKFFLSLRGHSSSSFKAHHSQSFKEQLHRLFNFLLFTYSRHHLQFCTIVSKQPKMQFPEMCGTVTHTFVYDLSVSRPAKRTHQFD